MAKLVVAPVVAASSPIPAWLRFNLKYRKQTLSHCRQLLCNFTYNVAKVKYNVEI